jgi:hypothetical protein
MNSSIGDNKRRPGGDASLLTRSRKLGAIAQSYSQPSKQPRVPTASLIPCIVALNAGTQSLKFSENNGAIKANP